MADYAPVFRLTLYAADGVTPLTPRSGAAHSDPFVVATAAGITGAQPYLDLPRGRQGAFDPLTKKRTKGQLTFRLLDKRTATGNLTRWVTAFLGDDAGANQLGGKAVKVELSLDGGGSFSDWWTGRVAQDGLDGALWFQLVCKDRTDDLDVPVFVGAPHPDASYAHQAQLAPIGLMHDYGDFPTVAAISGTVKTSTGSFMVIDADRKQRDPKRLTVTQALWDLWRYESDPALRPQVVVTAGATTTRWLLRAPFGNRRNSVEFVHCVPIEGSGATMPAAGTSVTFYIEASGTTASEALPVLVDDVHPVTFIKGLAAGHFGRLTAAGAVSWSFPVDSATADPLEADTSFTPYRRAFDKPMKLSEVLEDVCRHAQLGYDLTAAGGLTLFDLRRSATATIAATITDADLVAAAGPVRAFHDQDAAVTVISASYVAETLVTDNELPKPFEDATPNEPYPDIPTVRIRSAKVPAVVYWDAEALAAGAKPAEQSFEAPGMRFRTATPGDLSTKAEELHGIARDVYLRRQLATIAKDLEAPFARGPVWYDLVGRLASANVALVRVGRYFVLDADVVPDPATNLRGGQRLVLCTSRSEEGLQVRLKALDCGASGTAVAPTIGTPTERLADETYCAEATVTLNASSQPARVDYAVTATSVGTRPADDSPLWTKGADVRATGQALIPRAPMGGRLWVRARTEPQTGELLQIPSSWVYPAGTGYVDLTGITAPSGLAASSPTADTTALTWTSGDATKRVEVYLTAGTVPGSWTSAMRVATLDAGSVKCALGFLAVLAAATQYSAAVRHIDDAGGASSFATVTFTTGALGTLTAPGFETGFSGSIDPTLGVPQSDGVYGMAVVAMAFPGWVEFEVRTETGIASGSYGAWENFGRVAAKSGTWTLAYAIAPNDRLRRQLRARSARDGATPSAYTPTVTVTPWTVEQIPGFPTAGYLRLNPLAPLTGEGPLYVRTQAEWVDPSGVAGEVEVVSISSNTAISTGTAAGTYVASPAIWKFTRPSAGNGTGTALLRGKGKGGLDEAILIIPEVGNDAPLLAVSARILSSSTTTPGYRVYVSHNDPVNTATVTLAASAVGVSITSDPGAFGVPPSTTVYADYTVTVPTVAQPQGRVVWTATATNFVKGQDAANFGDQGVDYTTPLLTVTVTPGGTSFGVSYTTTGSLAYYIDGVLQATPSSPFTITRNASGGQPKLIELKATHATSGEIARFPFTVPAQDPGPTIKLSGFSAWKDSPSAGNMQVFFSVTDAPSGATYKCFYDIVSGDLGTQSSVSSGSYWAISSFGTGDAKVTVQAYDSSGNTIGAPISVWGALTV